MSHTTVEFEQRPNEAQLGVVLGYGEIGTSRIHVENQSEVFCVRPVPIPLKAFAIWMYFCCALFVAIAFFLPDDARLKVLILTGVGAVMIIPLMIGMFVFLNEQTGTQPYLSIDPESKTVELPRLDMVLPIEDVTEVVFANFGGLHYQVALLVHRAANPWGYLHVYNDVGTPTSFSKSTHQQIADHLGVPVTNLKIKKRDAKLLINQTQN